MKKKLIFMLGIAILLPCATSTSIASSLIYTTSTPILSSLTDFSSSLAFTQFDPSLGTLQSVELDFSSALNTTLTIQNQSPTSSSFGSANTELLVTVQDAGNNLIAPELDLTSPGFTYTLGAGQSLTSGLLSQSGSSSDLYTLPAVLSEFTGVGTFSLAGSTFTQTLLANSGGNTTASQTTYASLTGQVIYTYTAVPEPSTFGLLALGLGALPFLRRHRQIAGIFHRAI
jgi:hypothetical protein